MGYGALANYCDHVSSLNNTPLIDFIEDGKWNESAIRHHIPSLLVPMILNYKLQINEGIPDSAYWMLEDKGHFTITSAWEVIRKKKEPDIINNSIWHKNVPFKISFFIWRALRNKLPTNDSLARFGKEEEDCYCCYRKGKDNINHILVTGNFAKYIWKIHTQRVGLVTSRTNIRSLLMQWRSLQACNEVQKLLFIILPNIICWNLWKNRCSVKYGNKQSSILRVELAIFKDTMQIIQSVYSDFPWQNSWDRLFDYVDQCQQQLTITLVSWNRPPNGIHKLNTDGSAIINSGQTGGGGILRDNQGKLIYAFSIPLGFGTNNSAEIQAALHGLNWCQQHGFKKIILEVDSELLVKWITNS